MEKTMKEINIEEIETPNLDKLDDRLTLFVSICAGSITFSLCIIFWIGIVFPITETKHLPLLSLTFLIFGTFIIYSEIYWTLVLFFYRMFFYRFYEHFLKKNPLAYEEYLKYLEQEQYEEVQ